VKSEGASASRTRQSTRRAGAAPSTGMNTTELTCQELVELVTDYLEGLLSPEEQTRFERHLTICPGCVTYVEQLRETIALTGTLREEDVPPAARTALLEQFADWKREHVGRNPE